MRAHAKKKNQGFTLIELIVVIAILAILAAFGIAAYSGIQKKAEASICESNRTSVARAIAVEAALSGSMDVDKANAVLASTFPDAESLCPSKGTYLIEENSSGQLIVSCTKHGKTPVQIVGENLDKLISNEKLLEYFKTKTSLDSTGPNFGVPIKKELASLLGISEDFDFRIWKDKDGSYKVYIFEPVSGKSAGDVVFATCYSFDSSWKPTDSGVSGTAPLATKSTIDDATKKPVTHLVLNAESFVPST